MVKTGRGAAHLRGGVCIGAADPGQPEPVREPRCGDVLEAGVGAVDGLNRGEVLDSAMVHALFARGIVARTGELTVRYRQSVRLGAPVRVVGRHRQAAHPLHYLEAEIWQGGALCARAQAKFMATQPLSK